MMGLFRRKAPSVESLLFTKVQSGQNQTAIELGWEEEWGMGEYWYCTQSSRLYKKVGDDFIWVKTFSLGEMVRKGKVCAIS